MKLPACMAALVLLLDKQELVQKPLRCSVEILPVLWESRELKRLPAWAP